MFKIGRIFPKKKFYEEYLTRRPTFIKKCFWKFWFLKYFKTKKFILERFVQFSTLKNDFENQNFEMFEEVVHNFGKSDSDII